MADVWASETPMPREMRDADESHYKVTLLALVLNGVIVQLVRALME